MRISAYNPSTFDNGDLIITGNILLTVATVLVIIFIIFYCIVLPSLSFLFPNESKSSESSQGYGYSSCSFRLPNFNTTDELNFCLGAPDFPLYPFFFCALVLVAFVVRHYELKVPFVKK